mmetsp:Transcript_47683/g.145038  ORF Transcript_47683/g.145038 Transcript_47683/m.145038 type:complete len:202 (-) Transcript_47683:195-800(-)
MPPRGHLSADGRHLLLPHPPRGLQEPHTEGDALEQHEHAGWPPLEERGGDACRVLARAPDADLLLEHARDEFLAGPELHRVHVHLQPDGRLDELACAPRSRADALEVFLDEILLLRRIELGETLLVSGYLGEPRHSDDGEPSAPEILEARQAAGRRGLLPRARAHATPLYGLLRVRPLPHQHVRLPLGPLLAHAAEARLAL